jgi:hypothetical protein
MMQPRPEGRRRIQLTNFVNGRPIIGKPAIFDRSIYFKHPLELFLFIMILIIYNFFDEIFIMAQLLL